MQNYMKIQYLNSDTDAERKKKPEKVQKQFEYGFFSNARYGTCNHNTSQTQNPANMSISRPR